MEWWIVILFLASGAYFAVLIHELGHTIFMKKARIDITKDWSNSRVTGKVISKWTNASGILFTILISFLITLIPLNFEKNVFDFLIYSIGLWCFILSMYPCAYAIIKYKHTKTIRSDMDMMFGKYKPIAGAVIILILLFTLGNFYFDHIYQFLGTF